MSAIAIGSLTSDVSLPPSPNPVALTKLLELWKAAKRPVIITGTGAARAAESLLELAETTSTPLFFSSKFATPSII
jgi:thiamine pyrophosphate-dependent acetolactate synthase large subunit-like protein